MATDNITFDFAEKFGLNIPGKFGNPNICNRPRRWAQTLAGKDMPADCSTLVPFIKANIDSQKKVVFNFVEFQGSINYLPKGLVSYSPVPFKHKIGNEEKNLKLTVRMNEGNCEIDFSQRSYSTIKFDGNTAIYYLKFQYAKFENNPSEEERWAIEFSSTNYQHISLLRSYFSEQLSEEGKQLIVTYFNYAFSSAGTSPKKLKALYSGCPIFVMNQRGDEQLWTDLKILLKFDKSSWFKDASSSMVSIITGFNDLEMAYEKLEKDPVLVLELYDYINGSNAGDYCVFLNMLSKLFASPARRKTHIEIPYGKGYSLDSDLFFNTKKGTINIAVYTKTRVPIPKPPSLPAGITIPDSTISYNLLLNQPALHPLDIITLYDVETKKKQYVPAIYVKYLSDMKEWGDIIEAIVIVVDLIIIIVSVGTLTGEAVALSSAIIASIDLGLAAIDLALKFDPVKSFLSQSAVGKWFVDNWDEIFPAAGIVMLTPMLTRGLLKYGASVIKELSRLGDTLATEFADIIRKLILKIKVELYIASYNKIVLCSFEPFTMAAQLFGQTIARGMEEAGILLGKLSEGELKTLMYNGSKVAEGDIGEIRKILMEIFKKSGDDLIKYLEELIVTRNYKDIFSFRKAKKLPAYAKEESASGTVCKAEIEGKSFWGINSKLSPEANSLRQKWFKKITWVPPKKKAPAHLGHAQSLSHAEAHTLMNAFEELGSLPRNVTLYVDRATCNMCKGELPAIMKSMGIEELTIFSGNKQIPLIIKIKS
ncbi:MAG: hypothetical protein JNM19_02340 [Chitinophagaceae bacterium]|nr:hypothetical protein [Chitinophagaceae bacterium]